MPGLDELSNDALNKIAATEIMGWTFEIGPPLHKTYDVEWWRTEPRTGDGMAERGARFPAKDWWPCTDRNQSRRVVEAVLDGKGKVFFSKLSIVKYGYPLYLNMPALDAAQLLLATPRQEVEAAILAVRDIEGVRDLP